MGFKLLFVCTVSYIPITLVTDLDGSFGKTRGEIFWYAADVTL